MSTTDKKNEGLSTIVVDLMKSNKNILKDRGILIDNKIRRKAKEKVDKLLARRDEINEAIITSMDLRGDTKDSISFNAEKANVLIDTVFDSDVELLVIERKIEAARISVKRIFGTDDLNELSSKY